MQKAMVWQTVHDLRRGLVRDLDQLTDEQWQTPSWADGWTVADVVAHLIDSAKSTGWGLVKQLVAARGDFDTATQLGVDRERQLRHRDLVASYRSIIERTSGPPVDLRTRLVEEVAHGEDIRRALGLSYAYPLAATVPMLQYLAKAPAWLGGGATIADGLTLVATDAGLQWGRGPQVWGTSLSLGLALSGRRVHEHELQGPGRAALLSRVTPHRSH